MGLSIGNMILDITNKLYGKQISSFTDVSTLNSFQILLSVIIFIILLTFIMCIGAYIFNNSVVKIMPSIMKKISVVDFLGLYIVTHILFC